MNGSPPGRDDELDDDLIVELARLLEEVGARVTFDSKRDVTVCMKCKAKNHHGWKAVAPGYEERDCRRVCTECARG